MSKKDFLKLIQDQRSKKKDQKFEGSLIDYMEMVKKDPGVVKLAHKRLYDAIETHGV